MRSAPFRPYVRISFDIVSAAAQAQPAHRQAGHEIPGLYPDWIAALPPDGPAAAPRLLAVLEGIPVLDAVGQTSLAEAAIAEVSS